MSRTIRRQSGRPETFQIYLDVETRRGGVYVEAFPIRKNHPEYRKESWRLLTDNVNGTLPAWASRLYTKKAARSEEQHLMEALRKGTEDALQLLPRKRNLRYDFL